MASMGGSPNIPDVSPVARPVTPEDAGVKAASDAVRRKIKAQTGRASTFIVPSGAGRGL